MAPIIHMETSRESQLDPAIGSDIDLETPVDGDISLRNVSIALTHKINNCLSGVFLRVQVLSELIKKADIVESLLCVEAIGHFVEEMTLLTAKLGQAARKSKNGAPGRQPEKGLVSSPEAKRLPRRKRKSKGYG